MKNQVKKPTAIFLLLAGLAFSNSLKAQQITFPYIITNNLTCPIVCTYNLYDPACVFVCSWSTGTILGSGGTFPVPYCVATDYMIDVTVTSINNTAINVAPNIPQGATVTYACLPQNLSDTGGCSTSCDVGGTGVWTITWTSTGCLIQ